MNKVILENGEGKFIRLLYFYISVGIAIISFGAVIAQPFIISNQLDIRIYQNEKDIKESLIDIKHLKQVDSYNKGLAREVKFNLKRLMIHLGLEYIEDVDK